MCFLEYSFVLKVTERDVFHQLVRSPDGHSRAGPAGARSFSQDRTRTWVDLTDSHSGASGATGSLPPTAELGQPGPGAPPCLPRGRQGAPALEPSPAASQGPWRERDQQRRQVQCKAPTCSAGVQVVPASTLRPVPRWHTRGVARHQAVLSQDTAPQPAALGRKPGEPSLRATGPVAALLQGFKWNAGRESRPLGHCPDAAVGRGPARSSSHAWRGRRSHLPLLKPDVDQLG